MPKRTDIRKILVIGSGPIVIGQAAEFDYAGTQACLALREEGYEVVLCNSNPATIMTDTSIADKVYMEPLTLEYIAKIIRYERPDAILPGIGGQTGLNLAVQLEKKGVLAECRTELLGTRSDSIEKAEDRQMFKELCESLGEPVLPSEIAHSLEEGIRAARRIGYPVVLRPAFTLGGTGGGFAQDEAAFLPMMKNALQLSPVREVLIEKSVKGYKEIEYEVMRDRNDTAVTICNMENVDPVGIHTGDSIVVCPSQTLTNKEYQMLRDSALKVIRALEIEGGCNVQFALDPQSFQYYLIEVNPRVSRSSALASKASGYPIARVSAKIGIGMTLDEIMLANTPACFEPALDYVVTKMPRFPFDKFTRPAESIPLPAAGAEGTTGQDPAGDAAEKSLLDPATGAEGTGCPGSAGDAAEKSLLDPAGGAAGQDPTGKEYKQLHAQEIDNTYCPSATNGDYSYKQLHAQEIDNTLSTQMKATGEVMSIGRTMEESLLKAVRSLETGHMHLYDPKFDHMETQGILEYIEEGREDRIFAIADLFRRCRKDTADPACGDMLETVRHRTGMDPLFLRVLDNIVRKEGEILAKPRDTEILWEAKRMGFSDAAIGHLWNMPEEEIFALRQEKGIVPVYKMIDTCASEFDSYVPYFYSTYEEENEAFPPVKKDLTEQKNVNGEPIKRGSVSMSETPAQKNAGVEEEIKRGSVSMSETSAQNNAGMEEERTGPASGFRTPEKRKVIVLGSGPIRIGQGVEFDYSTVHAVQTLQRAGYEAIIINNNPETVSTDYTCSDKLYFEALCVEDVMNIIAMEKPEGVIATLGGQTAVNLAQPLHARGVRLIGTDCDAIERAENRDAFERLLEELEIPQPKGRAVTNVEAGIRAAAQIGYPVLVRPSFVLGGRAMQIVGKEEEMHEYLRNAVQIDEDKPVLVDKYIRGREVEVDAICDGETVFVPGIMELVERTGVHSGDSISVYPPRSLSENVRETILDYAWKLGMGIGIRGLFNIQFIVDADDEVFIIEVNPRSSRTVPFLSKATGYSLADIATLVSLGVTLRDQGITGNKTEAITETNAAATDASIGHGTICMSDKKKAATEFTETRYGAPHRVPASRAPAAKTVCREEPVSRNGNCAFLPDKNGVKTPFIEEEGKKAIYPPEKTRYYVKVPAFSFSKLHGMDAYLSPEMKSTGEAIGYDKKLHRAMYKAMVASGMRLRSYGTVIVSVADEDKLETIPLIRRFYDMGFNIEATTLTGEYLKRAGIRTRIRHKPSEGSTEILDSIRAGYVSYVINTRAILSGVHYGDGILIRDCAAQNNAVMLTSLDTVRMLLDVLEEVTMGISTIDGA